MKSVNGVVITLVISILIYSFGAMAYMHGTFVSKDVFSMLLTRITAIDNKINSCEGAK